MTKMTELYGTEDYNELSKDVKYDMEKFKDPYVVGAMIHRLVEERKLTNQMLRDIHRKINHLSRLMEETGAEPRKMQEALLAEQDERILEFVRKKGRVDATDVQFEFEYKGKNAASARLNALEKADFLTKKRAGRRVIFAAR